MFNSSRARPWQFFLRIGLPLSLILGAIGLAAVLFYTANVRERLEQRENHLAMLMAGTINGTLDHKAQMLGAIARSVPRASVSNSLAPAAFANEFNTLSAFDARGVLLAGPRLISIPAPGEVRVLANSQLAISAPDSESGITWVGTFDSAALTVPVLLSSEGAKNTRVYLLDSNGQVMFSNKQQTATTDSQGVTAALRDDVDRLLDNHVRSQVELVTARGPSGLTLIVQEPWDTLINPLYLYLVGLPLTLMLLTLAGTMFLTLNQRTSGERRQLRAYAQALTQAQEAERARLARELHDDTIQNLVALHQRVQLARMDSQRDSPTAVKRFDSLRADIVTMIDNVRRYSHALRPIYLEEGTLSAALQRLVSEADQTGSRNSPPCRVSFIAPDRGFTTQSDVKLTLFRIAQEAVTNALKHAQATHIVVRLEETGASPNQRPKLFVEDNGRGFAVDAALNGLGLINMRERASLIGARIDVASAPLQGTRITVSIP